MKKAIFVLVLIGLITVEVSAQSKGDSARYHYESAIKEDWVKLDSASVPAGVQRTLKGPDYQGWTVFCVWRNADTSEFKVELTKLGETRIYWFDLNGNRLHRNRKQIIKS